MICYNKIDLIKYWKCQTWPQSLVLWSLLSMITSIRSSVGSFWTQTCLHTLSKPNLLSSRTTSNAPRHWLTSRMEGKWTARLIANTLARIARSSTARRIQSRSTSVWDATSTTTVSTLPRCSRSIPMRTGGCSRDSSFISLGLVALSWLPSGSISMQSSLIFTPTTLWLIRAWLRLLFTLGSWGWLSAQVRYTLYWFTTSQYSGGTTYQTR